MKTELKKVAIYVAVITLLIISWIADACTSAKDAVAKDCEHSLSNDCTETYGLITYLPGVSKSAYGQASVTGVLINSSTLLPRQGLIVRLAEVLCDDDGNGNTYPSVPPEIQQSYVGNLVSSRDKVFCIFVLDVANSPGDITDENGVFLIEGVPYNAYGYVPLVMEGEPGFYPVYALLDENGETLVVRIIAGLIDIGTFLIDL